MAEYVSKISKCKNSHGVAVSSLLLCGMLFGNLIGYEGTSDERLSSLVDSLVSQKESFKGQEDVDETVLEYWSLLKNAFHEDGEDPSKGVRSFLNSPLEFMLLQKSIQTHMYSISVLHPIATYIRTTLLKLTDTQLSTALSLIASNIPSSSENKIKNFEEPMTKKAKGSHRFSDKLVRWRTATRIVQSFSDDDFGEERWGQNENLHNDLKSRLKREYDAFCPDLILLTHSCVPNCFIEGSTTLSNPNDLSEVDSESGMQSVLITLIALHDIKKFDVLTISKIPDLNCSVQERAVSLRRIYGPTFECMCARCRWERCVYYRKKFEVRKENIHISDSGDLSFSLKDLKSLGDLAMQQSRYDDACVLYEEILRCQPYNADVLHAKCASFLERGMFKEAQRQWREAYHFCDDHKEISLQVRKQEAYRSVLEKDDICSKIAITNDIFIDLLDGKCFVTTQPILTRQECSRAIEWAEENAKSRGNGWTTSRHYAVPTTDIPIHEIPELLQWFNKILTTRLRPLLALQYGPKEVGDHGRNVFIHDAFIVRYDSDGGQNHLPLHLDQSTHSLTISLNAPEDYDGGGTWLVPLGHAIRPILGGVLSFRGDKILHGGDPIVRGRRYIIVAFCFIARDHEEDTFKGVIDKKKPKSNFTFDFFDNNT